MSDKIQCEINGKKISVKKGTTIIEAFRSLNQDIAHYCWHPGLSIAGVCRLCMVEIQGQPRLQIACNTEVQKNMIITNQSEKVKEAVRWGMDFHLINHPLDCPICDQAGECGLQELYMQFGAYDPDMAERKVKKRKVVDLGEKIVLDTERCILCSRCVRFTEEVSKTNELGIFNRGDRSEIGTFKDKPLNNNYSLNTVDICPVGALTSKDFRFRQRVWYLKSARSVCPGCSTGCNIKVYYNEEGLFRIEPIYNKEVNGHWMCDEGRKSYKFVNLEHRLKMAKVGYKEHWKEMLPWEGIKKLREELKEAFKEKNSSSVALVLTAQYLTEEYEALLKWFKTLSSPNLFHWKCEPKKGEKDFDGILFRSDRNPNTYGLKKLLDNGSPPKVKSLNSLEEELKKGTIQFLLVAGPENQEVYPDMKEKVQTFSKAKHLVWFTACKSQTLDDVKTKTTQIPMRTFFEKEGTFQNYKGLKQKIKPGTHLVPQALTLEEVSLLLKGKDIHFKERGSSEDYLKTNHFATNKRALS